MLINLYSSSREYEMISVTRRTQKIKTAMSPDDIYTPWTKNINFISWVSFLVCYFYVGSDNFHQLSIPPLSWYTSVNPNCLSFLTPGILRWAERHITTVVTSGDNSSCFIVSKRRDRQVFRAFNMRLVPFHFWANIYNLNIILLKSFIYFLSAHFGYFSKR